jgi:PAS domain S-box-containing protein
MIQRISKHLSLNWKGYLCAIGATALATWLKYLAEPDIIPTDVPILYLLAIVPTAIFFGFGPAVLVSVLSLFAFNYFFISPLHQFTFEIFSIPLLVIFLVVGILFSYMASNLRQKNIIAAQEIAVRKQAESELTKYRDHLEDEVKQRTGELEQERNLLKAIMDSAGNTHLVYLDRDFNFIRVNPPYARTCGYKPEEMVGKNHFALYPDKENEAIFARVRDTGIPVAYHDKPFEFPDQPERGITHWDWTLSPVKDEHGQVKGLVFSLTETTERKKAEVALQKYTHELEVANRELEAFSYSVSHDLRAPLRTLDGFSEMIAEEYANKLDEEGKDYLNRIRKASHTMSQLIEDILKLSRISRAEMHQQKVDLSSIAKDIMDELQTTQPDRKAEIVIESGIQVTGDANLLQVAMQNLLENAWKYTGKSPLARIELGSLNQEGERVYYVRDNGIGFDMKYQDKLFQPFHRLHTSKEYPGTGIGLANVQRVIHKHNGRIWAESEVDKGTTFYFTLE